MSRACACRRRGRLPWRCVAGGFSHRGSSRARRRYDKNFGRGGASAARRAAARAAGKRRREASRPAACGLGFARRRERVDDAVDRLRRRRSYAASRRRDDRSRHREHRCHRRAVAHFAGQDDVRIGPHETVDRPRRSSSTSEPISQCAMLDRIGWWGYSTGSSAVTITRSCVRLMRSMSAATAVVLPLPVGPVKIMSPLVCDVSAATMSGKPSVSSAGMPIG